jgi:toxin ParE1/3/4
VKVRFTLSARAQFLDGLRFIHRENPPAAALRRKVETRLRRLERFPDSGRRIPEFPELPYREIVVNPFRFFYRAQGTVVWVVAAWHAAQLPDEP